MYNIYKKNNYNLMYNQKRLPDLFKPYAYSLLAMSRIQIVVCLTEEP